MNDLALQIGQRHDIVIDYAERADAGRGEIHQHGSTEPTGADHQPEVAVELRDVARDTAVVLRVDRLAGELELEFNPQGTLAERIRAGGAGIPAFYTKTGVGTLIAEGKEVKEFDGQKYLMERGLFADLAIVHAWKGDTAGNLVYRKTARNFNPMMATAAKITVAEVEHLVPAGEIDPDHIHTPGIFVKRMIEVGTGNKRIEFRNTRPRPAA